MLRHPRHGRGRIVGMSLALLFVVGCSTAEAGSDSTALDTTTTTAATIAAPPTVTAPSEPPTSAAAVVPDTVATTVAPAPPPDPAALLSGALSSLGSTYRFSGTITLNGATAATAEGDRVGDGSRFDVTSNDATVSYVVLPDATWVRQGDGAWEALQDPPAAVDPIDALAAPVGTTLIAGDAQAAQIDVVVDPTALGIASDAPVVVHASIGAGALTSVSYDTVQNGVTAQIVTTFGPALDPSPVAAPI